MSNSTEEDNLLLIKISQGDQAALESLYDQYAPLLTGIGMQYMSSRVVVEDITHDVFMEIWRTSSDFDPNRGSARTWIVMKMRCRLLDRLRRTSRRRNLLHQYGQVLEPAHLPSPLDNTMHSQVQEAIQALPDHLQDVIMTIYYDGLSSTEASQTLDIPTGTVKSRLAKARTLLKDILADKGDK